MQNNKHLLQIVLTLAILCGAFVGLSRTVHAQTQPYQYVPLATIPIGTSGTYLTQAGASTTPSTYIQNLYTFAFSIGIVIAVVSGVWAGVEWMLGGDSPSKIQSAKSRLENVGWGFALLLCSYVILDLINPQLVNFNLNLGTIDTGVQQKNLTEQQTTEAALATQAQATAQALQTAQATGTSLQQQLTEAKGNLSIDEISDPTDIGQITADQLKVAALQDEISQQQSTITQSTAAAENALGISLFTKAFDAGDSATAQSTLQTTDQQLTNQANAATAAGNSTLASQISAQKSAFDSTTNQTVEMNQALQAFTANSQDTSSHLGPVATINAIQQAESAAEKAEDVVGQLQSTNQQSAATALQTTTAANLTKLKSLYNCNPNNLIVTGVGTTGIGCQQ